MTFVLGNGRFACGWLMGLYGASFGYFFWFMPDSLFLIVVWKSFYMLYYIVSSTT